jgi:hypothetical protein
VDRVSGYSRRGPGFDSLHYQIICVAVGLVRGPLSLVMITIYAYPRLKTTALNCSGQRVTPRTVCCSVKRHWKLHGHGPGANLPWSWPAHDTIVPWRHVVRSPHRFERIHYLPFQGRIHTHLLASTLQGNRTHNKNLILTYIYIYICVCVCVCVCYSSLAD